VRYGFAIDQRTCIGCHACTVACKTEHQVPVGQFRTWVKYVEKGSFPDTTREMAVLRCNHCTDAPCVQSCPTEALFTRDDGIVDFDNSRCIGCKMCMQACPYDAIYIDEETHTAAKCNFCAHRIDQGLEPACVQVCPTESIWVGDLDDPDSGIRKLLSIEPVTVRAPEQNTSPNVFYVGADKAALDPLVAPVDQTYLWAEPDVLRLQTASELPGDPITNARTTLNTAHLRPWGWKVWTYLWTKSVAAGAGALAALLLLMTGSDSTLVTTAAPFIAVAFLLATSVLLIWDLKQPKRFVFLLMPWMLNKRSWLAIGGIFLGLYSAITGIWFLIGVANILGLGDYTSIINILAWPAIPAAIMTAGYTAFLFGQAEGRDLWQSPVLFWHLQAQAVMAGAGVLLVAGVIMDFAGEGFVSITWLAWALFIGTVANLLILAVEYGGKHSTRNAAVAAHMLTHGRYKRAFWGGALGLSVLTAVLALVGALNENLGLLAVLGGVIAQASLLIYESVYVKAGQDVPLS
jgi:Fe-S-cluster-containing dehydrogenase component/formate-dependent nitrite reductase membrane component NrfD